MLVLKRTMTEHLCPKINELKAYSDDKLATGQFYSQYRGFGAADFLISVLATAKKYRNGTVQDGVLCVVHAQTTETIDRDSVASGVGQLMAAMGRPAGFNISEGKSHLEMYQSLLMRVEKLLN